MSFSRVLLGFVRRGVPNGNGMEMGVFFGGNDWNDWVVSSLILERVSGVELLASRGGLSI